MSAFLQALQVRTFRMNLQRRAYGYRDEEYFKLKIIAAFLPPLGPRATTALE
jgi:hypothetical protein